MYRIALICFVILSASSSFAQDDKPIIQVNPPNLQNAPFRVGAGFEARFVPLQDGLHFSPQTVLVAEYCFASNLCATGSGNLFFGDFSFVDNDDRSRGFDGAISFGLRYIFNPGPSEFSLFGSTRAGYQNVGGSDRVSFGLSGGLAFEQQLWKNIRARLSTPLVSFAGASSLGFGIRFAVSPMGALVLAF